MAEKFEAPFRLVEGLPRIAQDQLRRNFDEITAFGKKLFPGSSEFDAIVDQTLSADNLAAAPPVFATVQSAITTMYGRGFTTLVKIGVRATPSKNPDTAAVNAAAVPAWVHLKGMRLGSPIDPAAAFPFDSTSPTSTWDWGGFRHDFSTGLVIEDMDVRFGGGPSTLFPTSGPYFTIARRSNIAGDSTGSGTAVWGRNTVGETVWSEETHWVDTNISTDRLWMVGGSVVFNVLAAPAWGSGSTTGALFMSGVQITVPITGPATWSLQFISSYVVGCWFTLNSWSVGSSGMTTIVVTFQTADGGVFWDSSSAQWGGLPQVGAVSVVTINQRWGVFRGTFQDLTLGATVAGTIDGYQVDAAMTGSLDVTGPAQVNAILGPGNGNTVTVRGTNVCGSIAIRYNGSGTAVKLIGATYCNLDIAGRLFAGAIAQVPYNLNAASTNNYLRYTGKTTYPGAGVNAGANNRIGTPEVAGS